MDPPIAKQGDRVVGGDTHVVLVASPAGPVPTALRLPFDGAIGAATAATVFIDEKNVAVVGSVATNTVPHIPVGGPFLRTPSNRGVISTGSDSVFADEIPVARANDKVECCNDPVDRASGHVVATGTVYTRG